MRRAAAFGALLVGVGMVATCARSGDTVPELLSASQQIAVREAWQAKRHGMLLGMMRRHDVGMWIVVNEEFHPDPLTELVVSPRPVVGKRDFFVFADTGTDTLRTVAVTRYAEEHILRFFECPDEPRPAEKVLPELFREVNPGSIALSFDGTRGPTSSLSHDAYRFLAGALGPEAEARFVSAEGLVKEILDTRIPEEMPHYETLVRLTDALVRRALSDEVIVPGTTTVGDVRDWLYDQVGAYGLKTWFQPDLRVQRRGEEGATSRGFLAVAPESTVIEPGDLIHVDFGMVYLGLASDWQRMAYVLRPGEDQAPAGLREALARTNLLQDTIAGVCRPGMDTADAYDAIMAVMEERGIEAQVYSHALGNHGHGVGPTIDFRAAKRASGSERALLRAGSYFAIELNTRMAIQEWDGQVVYVMEEDPAWLSDDGWVFFRPRQESFYLVRSQ